MGKVKLSLVSIARRWNEPKGRKDLIRGNARDFTRITEATGNSYKGRKSLDLAFSIGGIINIGIGQTRTITDGHGRTRTDMDTL